MAMWQQIRNNWIDCWRIDTRSLALFRIVLSGLLLYDALHRLSDVTLFLSDEGMFPSVWYQKSAADWNWSIHHWFGGWKWPAFLLIIQSLAAIGLMIGWKTRWMAVISWVLLISVQHRFTSLLQGSDTLMATLLFWSLFLPVSTHFSVDGALNTAPRPKRILSAGTVALLLQAMYVYVIGASIKLNPLWADEWITNHDAVFFATHMIDYSTAFGRWLGEYFILTKFLTVTVWALEMFGPFLMFLPWQTTHWRYAVLILLVLMHTGFQMALAIGPFPMTSLCSLIPFLPSHFWDVVMRPFATAPRRRNVTLYYDRPCEFCRKMCLILREFFLHRDVRIVPAQSRTDMGYLLVREHSWLVRDHWGRLWTHWNAMLAVWRGSLWGWPKVALFRIPGLSALGRRLYQSVADNRGMLARLSALLLPYRYRPWHPHWAVELPVAFLAFLVLWWNLANVSFFPYPFPEMEKPIIRYLKLHQRWNMFCPTGQRSGWYVIEGLKQDGTLMDAQTGQDGTPSRAIPENIPDYYGGFRWRKLMAHNNFPFIQVPYAYYLCRKWNATLPEGRKLTAIHYWFESYAFTGYDYEAIRMPRQSMGKIPCLPEHIESPLQPGGKSVHTQ